MKSRFFEDIALGEMRECGSYTVEREEIVEFGHRYDPQPFHVDEEAAARSPFGGLIASGWHTIAICMRLMVLEMIASDAGSWGSPGADEIRWLEPVRPGDTLSVRTEVIEKVPSRSKPDRGLVKIRATVSNQHDRNVMTFIGLGFFPRRSKQTAESGE